MTWTEEWKEEKIPLSSSVVATGSSAASNVAWSVFKQMAWMNIFLNFEHFIFWHVMACLRQGEGCRRYIFNIIAPFIPHCLHPPYTKAPVRSVTLTFLDTHRVQVVSLCLWIPSVGLQQTLYFMPWNYIRLLMCPGETNTPHHCH